MSCVPFHVSGRFLFTLSAVVLGKLCKVQTWGEKMVLPLYTVLQWKVQPWYVISDLLRLTLLLLTWERGLWLSAARAELGHDWNLGESDSTQLQLEEHVQACSSQRLRNFMAKLLKLHLSKYCKSTMLYFPPLVWKLLCYCSNTSAFYFSSQDIKHLFTRTARHSLTFKRSDLHQCATDFESFSISSKKEKQFWTIFIKHFHFVLWLLNCCVYLAIFLWIYRLVLFSLQREIEKIVAVAWNIFQPFLFGLIGAEVSVTSLRPETVGKIIHKLSSFNYWFRKNLYKEI